MTIATQVSSTTERFLEGKAALVTGATRNAGRAYAEMLGRRGASVIVHHNGQKSQAEAEQTAEAIRAAGGEAEVVQADLTKLSQLDGLFERTIERFGRLDVLINNAGVVIKKPLADFSEEEYDRAFALNAKAPFFLMKAASKGMQDDGRVINIGTTLLGATTSFYSVYAGSKAPLEDFTRALAKEVGARGITVNTVAPGPLNTSFFFPAETDESAAFLSSMSVTGKLGEISDIVPMVEFLVSPAARWVTAQTIFVNGGFVAR